MTATEIIATRLFGWQPFEDSTARVGFLPYRKDDATVYLNAHHEALNQAGSIHQDFPTFTDERLRWFWIRRMEDVLAARRLIYMYSYELSDIACGTPFAILRATAEQRVEAAVRVLNWAGGTNAR